MEDNGSTVVYFGFLFMVAYFLVLMIGMGSHRYHAARVIAKCVVINILFTEYFIFLSSVRVNHAYLISFPFNYVAVICTYAFNCFCVWRVDKKW